MALQYRDLLPQNAATCACMSSPASWEFPPPPHISWLPQAWGLPHTSWPPNISGSPHISGPPQALEFLPAQTMGLPPPPPGVPPIPSHPIYPTRDEPPGISDKHCHRSVCKGQCHKFRRILLEFKSPSPSLTLKHLHLASERIFVEKTFDCVPFISEGHGP